jgi:hypothetical protein
VSLKLAVSAFLKDEGGFLTPRAAVAQACFLRSSRRLRVRAQSRRAPTPRKSRFWRRKDAGQPAGGQRRRASSCRADQRLPRRRGLSLRVSDSLPMDLAWHRAAACHAASKFEPIGCTWQ